MAIRPFDDGNASALFRDLLENELRNIQSLGSEYVLRVPEDELERYHTDRVVMQPLTLNRSEMYMEEARPTKVDVTGEIGRIIKQGKRALVPGTLITIHVPYEGHEGLWRREPSEEKGQIYPMIEVTSTEISFAVKFPDDTEDSNKVRQDIDWQINNLIEGAKDLNKDVDEHNRSAKREIRKAIQRKRELAKKSVETLNALGIPVRRRDRPLTYAAPVKRKPDVTRPQAPAGRCEPEPELVEEEYRHILDVMRSMALVMERFPGVFAELHEEAIRAHLLLQLNGHYEGSATGETFNCEGKTDILIRASNRTVFIAECKFWDGPEKFHEAVDQILSYLSWRDTKCALLIFNTRKNSTAVHKKMHAAMEERKEHQRTVEHDPAGNGDSRYVFVKESDDRREIIITTQIYDVPLPDKAG